MEHQPFFPIPEFPPLPHLLILVLFNSRLARGFSRFSSSTQRRSPCSGGYFFPAPRAMNALPPLVDKPLPLSVFRGHSFSSTLHESSQRPHCVSIVPPLQVKRTLAFPIARSFGSRELTPCPGGVGGFQSCTLSFSFYFPSDN